MFNAFAYQYKLKIVNDEKNIVTLTPTKGTWLKALLPILLFPAGLAVIGAISMLFEEKQPPAAESEELPFNVE